VLVDLDSGDLSRAIATDILAGAGYQLLSFKWYRSRRHRHAVLTVAPKPRSLMERIALQLLCGSDPKREANNIRRARLLKRMPGWARQTANVLYEK
jgi:hypothetical protein